MTPSRSGQFLVYQTQDGKLKIDVRFEGETVWLTQQQMGELFQTSVPNISMHIRNIFTEGELQADSVVKESLTTAADGKNYATRFYNLDVIISVGYRVKSHRGTQFRMWATQRLREYIVKGFVLDDERLKNPDQPFDYFEELTRRIQDIRTSERRFYQKITDIYATSIDYDPTRDISIRFFKTVQNKVHWAIAGHTAAEIVHERVDAAKPNLGLTNWRGATIRKELNTRSSEHSQPLMLVPWMRTSIGPRDNYRNWRRQKRRSAQNVNESRCGLLSSSFVGFHPLLHDEAGDGRGV